MTTHQDRPASSSRCWPLYFSVKPETIPAEAMTRAFRESGSGGDRKRIPRATLWRIGLEGWQSPIPSATWLAVESRSVSHLIASSGPNSSRPEPNASDTDPTPHHGMKIASCNVTTGVHPRSRGATVSMTSEDPSRCSSQLAVFIPVDAPDWPSRQSANVPSSSGSARRSGMGPAFVTVPILRLSNGTRLLCSSSCSPTTPFSARPTRKVCPANTMRSCTTRRGVRPPFGNPRRTVRFGKPLVSTR